MSDPNATLSPTEAVAASMITSPDNKPAPSTVAAPLPNDLNAPPNPQSPQPSPTAPEPPAEPTAPVPVEGPPEPPDSLLDDPGDADDFDPNSIDLESVDPKIRPNLGKMRKLLETKQTDLEKAIERNKQLEAQLDGREPPADLKALTEERDTLLETLSKVSLENDPRFVAKYDGQMSATKNAILQTVQGLGIDDAESIVNAASQTPTMQRMSYLLSALPEDKREMAGTLLPLFSQIDMLNGQRAQELEAHAKTREVLNQQTAEDAAKAVASFREQHATQALETLGKEEMLLKKVQDNPEWNKGVDKLVGSAKKLFETEDPQEQAKAFVMASCMPVYKQLYLAERSRRATFEQALRERNIALPNVQAAKTAPKGGKTKLEAMTAEEAARASIEAASARMQ